jgi:hypothetical protein
MEVDFATGPDPTGRIAATRADCRADEKAPAPMRTPVGPTPHADVNGILVALSDGVRSIFGERLAGLYLTDR